MTGLITSRFRQSKPFALAIGVALLAVIAIGDHLTGFQLDLSVLYLAPVVFVSWTLGATSGILFALLAAAVWLSNAEFTGRLFPHAFFIYPYSFFHVWKALVLFATWAVFVFVLERLKLALARADERFATVLEGLDEAVYVVDPHSGELLYLNQDCRTTFGGAAPLSHLRQIDAQLEPAAPPTSGIGSGEFFDPARKRWYLVRTRTIPWVDGRSVHLNIATEITDRKQAEEVNLQQQQKLQLASQLANVGAMAATLAHEINQPLAAIVSYNMGCVRRLRAGNWDPQEILAALEKASAQAERAGRVIQRVRELVRKRKPDPAVCDINSLIADIASLIEMDADKNHVRLELELGPGLPQVHADRIMLEQAILNVTRNGIESMQQTPPAERQLTIRSRFDRSAGAIEIEIADTGCGIPESMLGNPAEPFFTTKPEGMGVGLSFCRSIIEFHDGRLRATRNSGPGSTFVLTLPAART